MFYTIDITTVTYSCLFVTNCQKQTESFLHAELTYPQKNNRNRLFKQRADFDRIPQGRFRKIARSTWYHTERHATDKRFLQGAVYCWCKNRKGEWFTTRDFLGGDNYYWEHYPLGVLYFRYIDAGQSED